MKDIVEFREIHGNSYPSITSLTSDIQDKNKHFIVEYLKNGKHIAESPAKAVDLVTGESLGIPLSMQSDGKYWWRSDVAYYYEKYNIKLNDDFVKYVISQ